MYWRNFITWLQHVVKAVENNITYKILVIIGTVAASIGILVSACMALVDYSNPKIPPVGTASPKADSVNKDNDVYSNIYITSDTNIGYIDGNTKENGQKNVVFRIINRSKIHIKDVSIQVIPSTFTTYRNDKTLFTTSAECYSSSPTGAAVWEITCKYIAVDGVVGFAASAPYAEGYPTGKLSIANSDGGKRVSF